jgi:WhiB family transcriptional regulator, redox-sensing transcriptional regulator
MAGSSWTPGTGVASSVTALLAGPDHPCRQHPELFFAESPRDVEQAKTLCQGCRARMACLAGALGRSEPWGIWGGELLIHGVIVPRKRPRGRPRKADVAA